MRGRLKFLLLYFFSWILLFLAARLLFELYHFNHTRELPFSTVLLSFVYGLRMDASMAAYILLPIILFMLIGMLLPFFRRPTIYLFYTYLLVLLFTLITVSDLEVFQSWGFRMDATPLKYVSSPREAWASISHLPLVLIFGGLVLTIVILCLLFRRLIRRELPVPPPNRRPIAALGLIAFGALLILPIRGGWQLSPLNESTVYFSKDDFANQAAINASWNFMNALWMGHGTKNPYNYVSAAVARHVADSLLADQGHTQMVLRNNRPNVIVVVWESFTEKATHAIVEGKEVTPHFNELKKEGLYFSQVYASGDRTDKGLAAVLGGYPALNNFSIIRYPGKSAKVNTLGDFFKGLGYYNTFYYGGEPEFANIKSFLLQGRMDAMVQKDNFHGSELNSKWGAHDGVVAGRLLRDLNKMPQPFFTTWLTLSSHEPFETPTPPVFAGTDVTTKFLNSLHYADESLYQLVHGCEQQPWWNNTVLVIIADHGHPMPDPSNPIDNFKIPMLWLGGALKQPGVVDKLCSQIDLASTLSAQINGPQKLFPYSKNILDSTSLPWAYYSFHSGFGFAQPQKMFAFDNVGKQVSLLRGQVTEKDIETGRTLQQLIYQDYLDK